MTTNNYTSVDQYIALQTPRVQIVLERVRSAIRKAVPAAEEMISYRIPTFKLQDRVVLYFAGFKRHYSLYPCTPPLIAEFKDDLGPYEFNNKGTIRFPLTEPVPVKLIGRIAKYRAKEAARGTGENSAVSKKRRGRV